MWILKFGLTYFFKKYYSEFDESALEDAILQALGDSEQQPRMARDAEESFMDGIQGAHSSTFRQSQPGNEGKYFFHFFKGN